MQKEEFPEKAASSNASATYDRDRFAADRTIMAWIRTSLSMIGFGFTIFKFFEFLKDIALIKGTTVTAEGPEKLGKALVCLGVFFLVLATIQYILYMRALCKRAHEKYHLSAALIASFTLSILGLIIFFNMIFQESGLL